MFIRSVLHAILLVAAIGTLNGCKVTDPHDPRFDPMQFDFNDYKRDGELAEVLRIMLKPGMHRTEVEKYLVEIGEAQIIDQNGTNDFGYALDHDADFQKYRKQASQVTLYRRSGGGKASGWFVYILYDEAGHVMEIYEGRERLFGSDYKEGNQQ